jgi:hypothetical protein
VSITAYVKDEASLNGRKAAMLPIQASCAYTGRKKPVGLQLRNGNFQYIPVIAWNPQDIAFGSTAAC